MLPVQSVPLTEHKEQLSLTLTQKPGFVNGVIILDMQHQRKVL